MRFSKVFNIVGCHVGGEVCNVVVGGVGDVPGNSMFEKRLYLERERDDIRQLLLKEPRGSVIRSVNVVLPSTDPAAVMGYVIMEAEEYPVMSGGNTIAVATVLLETGMVPMQEPVTELTLESPAGLIRLRCECRDGKVLSVRFTNQPAFVYELDAKVEVTGLGTVTLDVAWGGMAYAIIDAASLGFDLVPDEARDLCLMGQRIKAAAAEQLVTVHPENPKFAGITNTEFTKPLEHQGDVIYSQNAVVVSPGRIDRCACGTGTSARLAVMHARGLIVPGQKFVHESLIGSRFESTIESLTTVGGYDAVVPSVAGQAWITDMSQVGLDPTDPFPLGYVLSDSWMRSSSTVTA
ncbi:proline racemase family protein [Arthrobacter sp. efr-133-R2A-120]|uniref:proline racemase family protein n=1 Tax=Arthrobacter sp. efr-133-R2A-120 TaxID=3040277 RepID=UPI0025514BB6|nr:proline racemase family protein [Arthrobacter sp. efr-133-R2A-120]